MAFEVDSRTLLNKLAFGPSEAELHGIAKMGAEGWLAQQLNPPAEDDCAARIASTHIRLKYVQQDAGGRSRRGALAGRARAADRAALEGGREGPGGTGADVFPHRRRLRHDDPRRAQPLAAARGAGGFLAQPLQRECGGRQPHRGGVADLRQRRDPPPCARQLPRDAGGRGQERRHADLPQQPVLARRRGQRELRARAVRASYARPAGLSQRALQPLARRARRARPPAAGLYRPGRLRGRPRFHRLVDRGWCRHRRRAPPADDRQVHLRRELARQLSEARSRHRVRSLPVTLGRWPACARSGGRSSRDRAVCLRKALSSPGVGHARCRRRCRRGQGLDRATAQARPDRPHGRGDRAFRRLPPLGRHQGEAAARALCVVCPFRGDSMQRPRPACWASSMAAASGCSAGGRRPAIPTKTTIG